MDTRFLYNNILESATLTATDTAAGYDVNNLLDRRSYTKWRANTYGTKYITGVVTATADTVAIFGHNFHSVNATVTLEYQDYDTATWIQAVALSITKDGSVSNQFPVIESQIAGWRVKIVTTSGNIPECAAIFIGEAAVFPFPPDSPHTDFVQKGLNESSISKTGNLLGVVNRGDETIFSLRFSNLLRTWVDTNLRDDWWVNYGKIGKPFIYIPDIDYDVEEVYLVKCSDEYQFQLPKSLLAYYDTIQIDLIGMRL